MNSLERLIASGNGEKLDCVPVAPGIGHYAAIKAKIPMTKVAWDPELMATAVLHSLDRHGYDAVSPITDYGLGTECMGSQVCIKDWEQIWVCEFGIQNPTDLKKVKLPDPMKDGRMPVVIGCEQILVEQVGAEVGVNGGLSGPLSFASSLRGTQKILYDVVDNPEFVHQMLSLSLEAAKSFGQAQIQHGGVKTINIYEPVATMLSSSMVEDFCFQYLSELIQFIHEKGAIVLLHVCGDTTRMLNRMIDIGVDIISLDVNVDLGKAKQIVAGRCSISGNVATQHLATLSADQIFNEACDCIDKAATGGKFTLSSSCEVPLETPEENIDAMVRAARVYGKSNLAD